MLNDAVLIPAPAPPPAVDGVFRTLSRSSLVWLPEHGIGYLPVTDSPYDAAYFEKYQGYAATGQGKAITDVRVELVARHAREKATLCDVGIGCGDFMEKARACGFRAFGYDINPTAIDWLNTRDAFLDPYLVPVDVLTFWDALEHIPDVEQMITNARDWVFCSLPVVPGAGPPRPDWKHYRRDEHCWYFTRAGLIEWMRGQGFVCVEHGTPESLLGREDIETFAFQRAQ